MAPTSISSILIPTLTGPETKTTASPLQAQSHISENLLYAGVAKVTRAFLYPQ